MEHNIYGHIIDFLGICPGASLLEINEAPFFASAAQVRDIEYHTSKEKQGAKTDWIICVTDNCSKIENTSSRTAILIQKPLSFWKYLRLRLCYPVKEIVRIKPSTQNSEIYMASTGFLETFKRIYRNADLNIIGKCLVALKVAMTPANRYPITVLVL